MKFNPTSVRNTVTEICAGIQLIFEILKLEIVTKANNRKQLELPQNLSPQFNSFADRLLPIKLRLNPNICRNQT